MFCGADVGQGWQNMTVDKAVVGPRQGTKGQGKPKDNGGGGLLYPRRRGFTVKQMDNRMLQF